MVVKPRVSAARSKLTAPMEFLTLKRRSDWPRREPARQCPLAADLRARHKKSFSTPCQKLFVKTSFIFILRVSLMVSRWKPPVVKAALRPCGDPIGWQSGRRCPDPFASQTKGLLKRGHEDMDPRLLNPAIVGAFRGATSASPELVQVRQDGLVEIAPQRGTWIHWRQGGLHPIS